MAGGKSTYLQNLLLDWYFRGGSATPPSTIYVSLFTAAPNDTGGGTECPIGTNGYARVAVALGTIAGSSTAFWPTQGPVTSWAGASSNAATSPGVIANGTAITFPNPTGTGWGTVVAFGMHSAASAGNLLYWGMLNPSKQIQGGDVPPSFAAGTLQISED